jgi:hypothetical protein
MSFWLGQKLDEVVGIAAEPLDFGEPAEGAVAGTA